MKVMIMAGGTGGHVFPALAVARKLKSRGHEPVWMGTKQGLESKVVPAEGLKIFPIKIEGIRGNGILKWITAPFKILAAIIAARKILRESGANVALGMGGFAAGPGAVAAKTLGIPLIIHEQNAVAGLTNRLLHKLSRKTLEAFPGTFPKDAKVIAVGNPVREDIAAMEPKEKASKHGRILVFGGSLGALALNNLMPAVCARFARDNMPYVWHQTGRGKFAPVAAAYKKRGMEVVSRLGENHPGIYVCEFIEDMGTAYQWADLVICRSGAMTVFEIAAAGRAAIFVPYPYAVDDHQWANADYLAAKNAALCLRQESLSVDTLFCKLRDLVRNPGRLIDMGKKAYRLRMTNSTDEVAAICEMEAAL